MEIIKTIEIRKFRSIKSLTSDLHPTDLNILVGRNDQGKSNVLRALNLFFNRETDLGQPFRFEDDYCYNANTGTGTRKEVRIDLIIDPPKNRFKDAKLLRWTKKWKRDGIVVDERTFVKNGSQIAPQSNIYRWLDKLKYRYVPAIKGTDYFSSLMGELHDVLNQSHSVDLQTQGEQFISGFQQITNKITEELNNQIGIPNTIQVPSDFKLLFANLDFGSKQKNNTYHLKQRGDGIKVRHIPIILKYMTDEERNISIPGFVKTDTIWGFEEPENNLELTYAYELADFFKQYSRDIQIFVTTHSPAFYSLGLNNNSGVNTYIINQDANGCTCIKKKDDKDYFDIHDEMGTLNIITPYLTQIIENEKEIQKLKNEIDTNTDKAKVYVLTEDEDIGNIKIILEANGFYIPQTEIISYYGCDQISSAIVIAKYIQTKKKDAVVIIHRDRDYLDDDEICQIKEKVKTEGFHFFTTIGTDIESNFINPDHINSLHSNITVQKASEFIDSATTLAEQDSINRLVDKTLSRCKPKNNAYAKTFSELLNKYSSNKGRFRYGKKVLGHLSSLVQQEIKRNPKLVNSSIYLEDKELCHIASETWGN